VRICIDLDGVIAELKGPTQSYADVAPVPGAAEHIASLRKAGHYVIVYTARHMKTCAGNVGMVIARLGKVTLDWLAKHGIEYDEIVFGKPWADIYIDDNALRFHTWEEIAQDGSSLPASREATRET
jgi:capsule biosynthesis phosphatase